MVSGVRSEMLLHVDRAVRLLGVGDERYGRLAVGAAGLAGSLEARRVVVLGLCIEALLGGVLPEGEDQEGQCQCCAEDQQPDVGRVQILLRSGLVVLRGLGADGADQTAECAGQEAVLDRSVVLVEGDGHEQHEHDQPREARQLVESLEVLCRIQEQVGSENGVDRGATEDEAPEGTFIVGAVVPGEEQRCDQKCQRKGQADGQGCGVHLASFRMNLF